jgi:hypothetical protein
MAPQLTKEEIMCDWTKCTEWHIAAKLLIKSYNILHKLPVDGFYIS